MKRSRCGSIASPRALEITPQWPAEVATLASEVSQARYAASKSAQTAGSATVKAAKKLDRMGLSRRDTADVLGISHQRVQQLLAVVDNCDQRRGRDPKASLAGRNWWRKPSDASSLAPVSVTPFVEMPCVRDLAEPLIRYLSLAAPEVPVEQPSANRLTSKATRLSG